MSKKTAENFLVKKLLNKDYSALDELMDIYSSKLYYYCYNILRNSIDAKETVQDIFIEVYKDMASFNEDDDLSIWIYQKISKKTNDILETKRTDIVLNNACNMSCEHDQSDIKDIDIHKRVLKMVNNVKCEKQCETTFKQIAELSVLEREILMLRYVENFSYEAISRILDCDIDIIKSCIIYTRETIFKR